MSFESSDETKRCICIRYTPSENYKRAYVPCYGQLSTNTWTFLTDQNKVNTGCISYCFIDLIKKDDIRLTRNTTMNDLSKKIKIHRTQTFYRDILLFDNSINYY